MKDLFSRVRWLAHLVKYNRLYDATYPLLTKGVSDLERYYAATHQDPETWGHDQCRDIKAALHHLRLAMHQLDPHRPLRTLSDTMSVIRDAATLERREARLRDLRPPDKRD